MKKLLTNLRQKKKISQKIDLFLMLLLTKYGNKNEEKILKIQLILKKGAK